ncbi:MAG: hypothetical protein V3V31_16150 [Methylococcales bacterium]
MDESTLSPIIIAATLSILAGGIGWIYKQFVEKNERKRKKINVAEIILVHVEQAVKALDKFVPDFKKDTEELIKSQDAHFFVPANESLDNIISVLKDHLILLPPELVSGIMLFNSYDVSLNELLRDMSSKDFITVRDKRKEKVVNSTISIAENLIPIGNDLTIAINSYIRNQNSTPPKFLYTQCNNGLKAVKKLFS